MDTLQHSFDDFSLHRAAARGDDERIRMAIESGADINALDDAGRTVIACAVAGENWEEIVDVSDATFMSPSRLRLLSALVGHPDISLYTLNAPQSSMRGVTPLGMAAWLNMPDAIKVMLEDSAETVSVDGMDTHGATALMYAARDGSLAVVQSLLEHGARPDFRDVNHRTCIHYALAHPQILWLCEAILRRHRWRESESVTKIRLFSDSERLLKLAATSLPPDSFCPPLIFFNNDAISRSTNTLIQAIRSSRLSLLHSLLFSPPSPLSPISPISSPILVNHPNAKGWSAIHHCVSVARPSVDILDTLYCAGCDVSLFTTNEHYTPLHCLAWAPLPSNDEDASALYQFTIHLVRDLRAPLSARDMHDETCIHVAAEHGQSIDVLIAFLDCDTTGSVRELRNSRGLTALEVARPQFCAAFGEDAEHVRPPSSQSMRTIRPVASFGSMSSLLKWTPPGREATQRGDDDSLVFSFKYNGSTSPQELLSNLRLTSPALDHDPTPANLDYLEAVLSDTAQIGRGIIHRFRTRIDDAASELYEAKTMCDTICTLRRVVKDRVDLEGCGVDLELVRGRRGTMDSEDSSVTACEAETIRKKSFSTPDLPKDCDSGAPIYKDVSVSTDSLLDVRKPTVNIISGTRLILGAEILEKFRPYVEPKTDKADVKFLDMDEGIPVPVRTRPTKDKTGGLRKEANLKLWMKTMKPEVGVPTSEEKTKVGMSGTAKFRAWFRKKVTPELPFKLELVREIDEGWGVGREVKQDRRATLAGEAIDGPHQPDAPNPINKLLQRSHVVLTAADRDLGSICQRTIVADQFIQAARQAVLRAEQILHKALEKRETAIAHLRSSCISSDLSCGRSPGSNDGYLRPPGSSMSSLPSSARSSMITLAATPKGDDEDTKALQRLLLRKIEARMVGAFDEIDKAVGWLQIVKEVVRGVKRRTYL